MVVVDFPYLNQVKHEAFVVSNGRTRVDSHRRILIVLRLDTLVVVVPVVLFPILKQVK